MNLKGYSIKAAAKINLSLDVLGKREDGYHNLQMIMQSVTLGDTLTVFPAAEGVIEVLSGTRYAPSGPGNTVYKAAQLVRQKYGILHGVRFVVEKRIPVAAGLAGGSSDGAAALKLLNRLWNLDMSLAELQQLGLQIGADVPFCVTNGTCLAEGVGEQLNELPFLEGVHILICKPPVPVSTAEVFRRFHLDETMNRPDTKRLLELIERKDIKGIAENMGNVLETVTIGMHPVVGDIKRKMMEMGALGAMMSGSGPSVFGIFGSLEDIKKAKMVLKADFRETYITETASAAWSNYIKNIRR